jgi:protein-disulfide isomerase
VNQGSINDGWASPENLREFANNIDLNMEQYDDCIGSTTYKQKIDANLQIGRENGISQTPTFVVLDRDGRFQKIEGKQPLTVFDEIIQNMN